VSVFVAFPRSGGGSTMADRNVSSSGKDAIQTGFALCDIDTARPHAARMYYALLGGHFL
jgi:hypothetical protein